MTLAGGKLTTFRPQAIEVLAACGAMIGRSVSDDGAPVFAPVPAVEIAGLSGASYGASCKVVGSLAVISRDGNTRRVPHHIVDGFECEVIHVLARDDGDRLWCLPGSQHQARGCGDGARCIGACAFGDGP
ncbi:hypothetical protein P308_14360 [Pseudomonas piscis]|nr:hypothetical protein P308_14360 [Pseudomonas piscis]